VGLKLKPLQKKLMDLLQAKGLGESEVANRVRMTFAGKRGLELKAFEVVALATITRKRLKITHLNRQRSERVERTISPQELVHYRTTGTSTPGAICAMAFAALVLTPLKMWKY
jgi:predicted DNA-binding transcriptional regulator YafY